MLFFETSLTLQMLCIRLAAVSYLNAVGDYYRQHACSHPEGDGSLEVVGSDITHYDLVDKHCADVLLR